MGDPMMLAAAILAVNVAAWPFIRRCARHAVYRERRRMLREDLDRWGTVDDDARR